MVLAFLTSVGAGASGLAAAEDILCSFALPAGSAEATLDAFSSQAGVQVVYLHDEVRGVPTIPVRGNFTPRAALERLLAGTELEAREDRNSGAIVIKRLRPAIQLGGSTHPSSPVQPMKNSLSARFAAGLAAFAAAVASAQPTMSSPPRPAGDLLQGTVLLTPFNVSTDRDTGYAAQETLAPACAPPCATSPRP